MRFDVTLQQRLEQRMILAPRMIQAMEILQLPLASLQERIDEEMVANPVIELRLNRPDEASESPAEAPADTAVPQGEGEQALVVQDEGGPEDFERLSQVVDRWETYFEDTASWRRRPVYDDIDPKTEATQNTPDDGQTLQEFLLDEWRLEDLDDRSRALGEVIIRNLDDNGYLRVVPEDLAGQVDPEATADEMEEALRRVQAVGPVGVAARDLTECLLLQLAADLVYGGGPGRLPPEAIEVRIIRDHLRDIEANRYPRVAAALGVTIDQVKQAIERIRRLNPKPGTAISPQRTPPILPDVRITWDEEVGEYVVSIEDGDTPELYISKAYRQMIKRRDLDEKTRTFVAKNIRSARWLMDAITQRRDTLRRVTESIVRFQRPFFDEGPEHIQPLKMQQVADDVRLHVGTISRAVADKYADTPWGIWPLRDFFMGGTETADGQEMSWDRVRVRLKAVVDAEDKKKPFSDEAIADHLRAEGIDVARRTVAKYREELGIPSSRRRREY
ncbi:MAG: RNA polymerase factor sigma-54 [Planctomycetes bacterium]|nr:RNA polymerase factor sigma-54 [Planctomycetota bacterium]